MELALVVNTTTACSDVWDMFIDSVDTHFPQIKSKYMFVDPTEYEFKGFKVINYDASSTYRDQFYHCIQQVNEKYCIYVAEDYILYNPVNWDLILKLNSVLDANPDLSFIKLIKGPESRLFKYKGFDNLYKLDNNDPNFYTNQATIWKTRDLEKIYELSPPAHIAWKGNMLQFEPNAYKICKKLNMQGVFYYNGEPLRGMAHHDSSVYPYIATALVKGKWNLSEYPIELSYYLRKFNIDINKRGIY